MSAASGRKKSIDHVRIWNSQELYPSLIDTLATASKFVSDDISQPPQGISNISEWCKKEACWQRIVAKVPGFAKTIPREFWDDSISVEDLDFETKSAKKTQVIDDGIEAQRKVLEITGPEWNNLMILGQKKKILTPKETGIMQIATQIPRKIPTEKTKHCSRKPFGEVPV